MKNEMELTIVHDGKQWIASNGTISAKGKTLPELDRNLKEVLIKNGTIGQGEKMTVYMRFDYSTIPTWIRQYASHYFNRCVSFEM